MENKKELNKKLREARKKINEEIKNVYFLSIQLKKSQENLQQMANDFIKLGE
jgi:hypothetical protein